MFLVLVCVPITVELFGFVTDLPWFVMILVAILAVVTVVLAVVLILVLANIMIEITTFLVGTITRVTGFVVL